MSGLELSLALGKDYDRMRALRTAEVTVPGVRLSTEILGITDSFQRALEFDLAEMSLSFYLALRSRLGDECPFIALPVFSSRMFRHSSVFVHTESRLGGPEDLAKGPWRVALPEYGTTMALWLRGILSDDYAADWAGSVWQAGRRSLVVDYRDYPIPPEYTLAAFDPAQPSLWQQVASGNVDMYFGRAPLGWQDGQQGVRRLFPDYRAVERDYFARTGVFPIMHLIVIRRERYEQDGWLAQPLFDAFLAAKQRALFDLQDVSTTTVALPGIGSVVEDAIADFGLDWWPYGVQRNLPTLRAALGYSARQGLLPDAELSVESLFPTELLHT